MTHGPDPVAAYFYTDSKLRIKLYIFKWLKNDISLCAKII